MKNIYSERKNHIDECDNYKIQNKKIHNKSFNPQRMRIAKNCLDTANLKIHHKHNIMGNVFSEKPLKEIVRENQRMIKKSIRELEKEIGNLKKNESKLIADIKKMAKQNQMV